MYSAHIETRGSRDLRLQVDQMSVQASQYGDDLRLMKGEVAEVNRLIGRLQSEIEALKAQVH